MARYEQNRTSYVYGNTARVLEPVYNPEVRNPERKKQVHTREKRQPVGGLDLVSFMFLVVAMGITLYVCFDYLCVQSQITATKKAIVALESEIIELQNENIAAKETINSSLDLEEIYDTAIKELGMVEATKGQIYFYKSEKSDMVKQYAQIPKGDASEENE